MDEYPHTPGHRGVDTSVAASQSIADKLAGLQGKVFAAIEASGAHGMTADELAVLFGMERHALRPRTAELRKMRKIADGGKRRLTVTGRKAIAWVTPEHVQPPEGGAA